MADLISDKDVKSLRTQKKRGFLRSAHCSVLALEVGLVMFPGKEEEMTDDINESANEQQLLEVTPLEEILVDDPDAGLQIMMSVLGVKLRRQICGLEDGRL
ncbi:Uncharacterized protein Fot_22707 [Forsythia ovata]|uniref:Uncharacterized protein n=1 Tax=Forsythia ovata TaxID=205694 RepID=A0ABD1UYV5_9LAMI